ncbi:MAG TPA: membrane protein insertion efficiency factor YidD [Verrucomicrobiae bacterium]
MNLLQHSLIFAIRIYRWTVSPAQIFLFGANAGCRFTPTCSQYAMAVLREQGVFPGTFLAVGRICRCHPFGDCGFDPVPQGGSKIQNSKFKTRGPAR